MENNNNNENGGEFYIRVVKGGENSASSFAIGAIAGFVMTTLIVGIVKSSIRVLTD